MSAQKMKNIVHPDMQRLTNFLYRFFWSIILRGTRVIHYMILTIIRTDSGLKEAVCF